MSVGGLVIEVVKISEEKVWINTDDKGDKCAVYVNPKGNEIKPGDYLWWHGDCYWTPKDKSQIEVELPKLSYSGVSRPKDYF